MGGLASDPNAVSPKERTPNWKKSAKEKRIGGEQSWTWRIAQTSIKG